MLRVLFALLFLSASAAGAGEIEAVLDAQAAAWNRGDLDAFMTTYERSRQITFIGKELQRGYDDVLARYRRTYGDKEKMGRLRFELIEVRMLGGDHALVLGRFFLTRSATGKFSLVLRKTRAGWKIIHDHTSA
jgi:uncharacterized protein (TIGR02246 family)